MKGRAAAVYRLRRRTPNSRQIRIFIKLLLLLDNAGVPIECLRCRVDAEGMKPEQLIPVKLLNSGTAG